MKPTRIAICFIPTLLAACSEMPNGFGDEHASSMLIAGGQFAQGSGGSSDNPTPNSRTNDKRPASEPAPSDHPPTALASLPTLPLDRIPARTTALQHRGISPGTPPALPTPW